MPDRTKNLLQDLRAKHHYQRVAIQGLNRNVQVLNRQLSNTSTNLTNTINYLNLSQAGVFYPETYGAIGDGLTDDGPAIQLALDAAKTNGGGIVQLGPATYGVSQNLGLTSATGVTIKGTGMGSSAIVDLRTDEVGAGSGSLTGTYAGLISFDTCSLCGAEDMTLIGNVSLPATDNTAIGGRKATFAANSVQIRNLRLEATNFRDEAIYCHGDCPGWSTKQCYIRDNNSNAININSNGITSAGCIISNNICVDNKHSGIIVSCNSAEIIGNDCYNDTLNVYGAAMIVLDSSGSFIFMGNIVHDITFTASVGALEVFGSSDANAASIISGNIFKNITGSWQPVVTGACIVVNDAGNAPSGSLSITGNHFSNISGITNEQNKLIHFTGCAATFSAYIAGNRLYGNDSLYMRIAIQSTNNTAGARIRVGPNEMFGWIVEYNNADGAMVFGESDYSTDRHIDHTSTPYESLISDSQVGCDTTTSGLTYRLPNSANYEGRNVFIYDEGQNASVNAITIDAATNGGTINGVASISITTDGAGAWCKCHAGAWKTVSVS